MAEDESNDQGKRMAASIASSTESTEFDLGGYGAEGCAKLASALEKPLPLPDMIRFTFVVGGGKKVRQKYADALPQILADALRKVGFSEDRGASLAVECAGLFKFQHNTDTDLKVTHVYPHIDREAAAAAAAANAPADDALSPKELILHAELSTFQKMMAAKCPSLAQRRRAHEVLKAARAELAAAETKMANLEMLTDDEQRRYDTLDAVGLEEKQAWLGKAMEGMVDSGQLTAAEKKAMIEQLASKMEQLEEQIGISEAEGKAKRTEKLRGMLMDLQARSATVRELTPIVRKVKFETEIKAAEKKLAELAKLENSKVVLPLAEVQKLNAKPKLLEDLAAMKSESRGWFAD
mmetsp:Transcript_18099/g.46281  ORF Transcript_18099/g.46281 Transcript_18099/m.46281 type:complete len:351 (+) Transcript_18099:56-1108(+)